MQTHIQTLKNPALRKQVNGNERGKREQEEQKQFGSNIAIAKN